MRSAVVSVLFVCFALAIAQVPDLPDQFIAKVTMSLPALGTNPGVIYFDYINSRVRYDIQSPFGNVISIQRYDIATPTEFDVFGSQCETKLLNDTMNPMTIPPFATYVGSETVDDQECDHWNVDMFGYINMDWWTTNVTDSDGKTTYQLVRFSEDAIGTQIDFQSVNAGPVDYSYFDVSSYGCTPPPPPVTYSVAGYVKNAINNKVLANGAVTLDGQTVNTDANGRYQFDGLRPGNYSFNATASGFYSAEITLTVTDNVPAGTSADFNLSPFLNNGQFRVVLTWAASPRDLDAHLRTPGCEVYFGRRVCGTASLDVDQRNGFGPETVTINGLSTGSYNYFVVNYSGEQPLTVSAGRIQVYGQGGLLADFSVPNTGSTAYRYWNGFTMDQTGAVTVINQLVASM